MNWPALKVVPLVLVEDCSFTFFPELPDKPCRNSKHNFSQKRAGFQSLMHFSDSISYRLLVTAGIR